MDQVTVALVCYQEKDLLSLVLQDIKNQSALDRIGEVLLFQNGSCQKTKKTFKTFLNQLPLKIFSSSSNNLGSARSILVNKSCHKLIAFTDADCRLPKNWLEQLLFHWKNESKNNVVAIGGPNVLPSKKLWQKVLNLSLCHPLGHGFSPQAWHVTEKTRVSHIPTTNALFLRSAVLDAGNFSSQYPFSGEDLDLGLRLQKKGKLVFFPDPVVTNHYAKTYFANLKRLFVFGDARGTSKEWFYPRFLFFPLCLSIAIGIFFQKVFFYPLAFYLGCLLFAEFWVGFKQKKLILSWMLPVFWFLQHFFYSMGTNYAILKQLRKIFKKTH